MEESIDICVIDDDPSQRKLVSRMLEKQGYGVEQAADGVEGLERIRERRPKVVLSDWMMPNLDGMGLCGAVRSDPAINDTYFILLTSRDKVDDKASALETGADDFLTKPCDVREMVARVRVGIRMWKLQRELRQAAVTDGLTGLYNHHHFSRLLEADYERSRRNVQPLSLMIVDLDHFKSINDTFGHETGNVVLRAVAETLKKSIRKSDVLARYGGEEFAVILPQTELKNAIILGERIRTAVPTSIPSGTLEGRDLTASCGVSTIDDSRVTSIEQLIDLADQALYKAKREGRNRVATCAELPLDASGQAAPQREEDVLRTQVRTLTDENFQLRRELVCAFVQAVGTADPEAARHVRSVKTYARAIGDHLNLDPERIVVLERAALLHEVGRIRLRPLTSDSASSRVAQSVQAGTLQVLDDVRALHAECVVIGSMFESYDGLGKPQGLRTEDIPVEARILRVADAFADALTEPVAGDPTETLGQAMSRIHAQSGSWYDPAVVRALAGCVGRYGEAWLFQRTQDTFV